LGPWSLGMTVTSFVRLWNRIMTGGPEGMAAQQAPRSKLSTGPRTIPVNCFHRVRRTRRIVAAGAAKDWRQGQLIESN